MISKHWPEFARGLAQFNAGECFEAHETLEALWMLADGSEKRLLQGLIQLAVAWHHWQQGNLTGARGVLARARDRLNGLELACLNLPQLVAEINQALEQLQTPTAAENALPPLKLNLLGNAGP